MKKSCLPYGTTGTAPFIFQYNAKQGGTWHRWCDSPRGQKAWRDVSGVLGKYGESRGGVGES